MDESAVDPGGETGSDQGTDYGGDDAQPTKPGVDPAMFTFCHDMDPAAPGEAVSIGYHNGDLKYHVSSQEPGDKEAVQFRPLHPFRVESVTLHFMGTPGAGKVRIVGDYGGSRPDEETDLVPPKDILVADISQPYVLDLSGEGLVVEPPTRFWVVYYHVDGGMFLALDTGDDPGDDSHSMYWNAKQIEQWKKEGQAFKWGGFDGNDYGVEVQGEYICKVEEKVFADRTSELPAFAGRKPGRMVIGDVDGDGWDDVLGVRGGQPLDDETGKLATGGQFLLRNNGAFHFEDISDGCGLVGTGITQAQFADIDDDGDVDAFGGAYVNLSDMDKDNGKRSSVFLNDGTGVFTEVAENGVGYEAPVAAAALFDYDGDGFLDLYLGAWLLKYPQPGASPDKLFKGVGDGTFKDVTAEAGIPTEPFKASPCYGVMPGDYNGDGLPDIYVANYGYAANALWSNNGDGTFTNRAKAAGVNYVVVDQMDGSGGNGFGGDWGDIDNDGDLDLFVANIAHPRYQPWSDRSVLYRNLGGDEPKFDVITGEAGIIYDEGDIDGTFVDFDNDGRLDLFTCPVYPHHYARLYRQKKDGTFAEITYFTGISVHECQSNTWSDLDHDGDLDLLAVSRREGGIPYVYENLVGQDNHFVAFRLEGKPSNRSAIGAWVMVTTGETTQMREVKAGRSHNGMGSTLVQHFGLGAADHVSGVQVRWPSGNVQAFGALAADRFYGLSEGDESPQELDW
ncbi:MAG: CRTAC1 family protein [Deltaproteobacteria bacterium]|nr:CRTAC1 family protein [Deltaproteobacteria bacterium]